MIRSKATASVLAALLWGCGGEAASGGAGAQGAASTVTGAGAGGAGGDGSGGSAAAAAGGSGGSGGSGGAGSTPGEAVADELARDLAGRFDSAAQAAEDPDYFGIQLRMCPVDAPELGPRVLYVEQAVMTKLGAPYRQRLYVVEPGKDAGTARSRVFELVDPGAFVGFCDAPAPRAVEAAQADERAGCRVDLTWKDDHFEGGTAGTFCPSSLNGAKYAQSVVSVRPDRIESWDRGFDAEGKQVWGAVKGPYVFDRKTPIGE